MRTIREIALEIKSDWKNVSPFAAQQLEAMTQLETMSDVYIAESAGMIVASFLGNATGWRGETARRIKKELNSMLKA